MNEFTEEKKLAILNYENQIIADKNSNPKKYHSYVSKKKKYNENKITLCLEGALVNDSEKCASALNSFFGSVYTKGPSQFPVFNVFPRPGDMQDVVFTLENIKSKLINLDCNKSMGPDSIPACILKNSADIFAPILLDIFEISYRDGIVPDQMKVANIVPLFKAGDRTICNNYRPVSLTPVIAKVFESIIHENLLKHIENNDIIHSAQHGFLKNHSTNTNLINFWNEVSQLADDVREVSIVYTDIRKAFDSVPHDLLIYKLKQYGISGKTLAWLSNFLQDRKQKVVINGMASELIHIESGVPQGGVLSGLLFILYMNDLPLQLKFLRTSMYADDAKLFGPIINSTSVKSIRTDREQPNNNNEADYEADDERVLPSIRQT